MSDEHIRQQMIELGASLMIRGCDLAADEIQRTDWDDLDLLQQCTYIEKYFGTLFTLRKYDAELSLDQGTRFRAALDQYEAALTEVGALPLG
jgi:hypothetical protein